MRTAAWASALAYAASPPSSGSPAARLRRPWSEWEQRQQLLLRHVCMFIVQAPDWVAGGGLQRPQMVQPELLLITILPTLTHSTCLQLQRRPLSGRLPEVHQRAGGGLRATRLRHNSLLRRCN